MAKQTAGPLIQLLRRDYVHAQDIAVVLEFLRRRLAEESIPFAVIGALALRQYGFVRATEDIEILTTPEGLEKIHATSASTASARRSPTGCHQCFEIGSLRSSEKRGRNPSWRNRYRTRFYLFVAEGMLPVYFYA